VVAIANTRPRRLET